MPKIGAKRPVWAPILAEVYGSTVTYQNPLVADRLIQATVTWERTADALRADDGIAESHNGVNGGKISTNVTNLTPAQKISMLGYAASGDGYIVNDSASPYGGFGYVTHDILTTNGVEAHTYNMHWLYKVQFSLNTEEAKTKGTGIEYSTPTIEGIVMPVFQDSTGRAQYELVVPYTLEADALAALNVKAGLSDTPSAGLSALSVTGAGGTLSPAFGAAIRYYTYGGLTAASFTVAPTAASHTIAMYVDDVFLQNVTSGAASGSIAMSIGTKKVKLVAYESGKSAQVTEIIVVKTA